jgi:iron complex outermembrane receptor protein
MSKHSLGAGLAGVLACTLIGDAVAQETAPASDTTLEAIIVTSQKRKEDIKEVPLSISVISGDTLKDNQIVDYTDLSRNIPNVSFMSQAGPGLSTIEIRGVTSLAGSATVGVYLDDVSLTTRNLYSMGVAEPRFFDLQKVETLRGPQGTLYGAGSMGGTIRFLSNQPDVGGFTSIASAQISQTEHGGTNYEAHGVVNVPLAASTAVRIGLQAGHDSGYIDQLNPNTLQTVNKGINGANWTVEKLALKTQIDRDWSITPSVFAQQYRTNDIDGAYLSVPYYQVGDGQGGGGPALGLYQTTKGVREPGDDHLTVLNLTANGDLHFADLTAVLSNYKRNFQRTQDGTAVNSNYIACQLQTTCYGNATGVTVTNPDSFVTAINNLPSAVYLGNTINSTALELRLASKDYDPTHGPFTWIAGAYYSRTKTNVTDNEPVFGINAAFQSFYGNNTAIGDPTVLGGAYPNDFPGDSSYYSARHYDERQKSLFGELTTHFGESVRLQTGLRWTDSVEDFRREGAWYFSGFSAITPSLPITSNSAEFTPRVSLQWDVDPTTMVYTNIAKGFRLGGANRPIPAAFAPPTFTPSFGPDSLWSYEIGSKSRLLDNRLTVNLAAYHIDWKNIQQDVFTPTGGFDFETNVGRATSNGVEFDTAYRITRGLTLTAAGNWTRAVFAEDVPALGATSGQAIQGVPKYSLHLGVEDHFPISSSLNGVARLNGNWTGSSYGTWVTTSPDYQRPQYFTSDISGGILKGHWEFGAFIKNLNNNHTVLQQMPIQFLNEAVYLRPRTYGLNVTGEF